MMTVILCMVILMVTVSMAFAGATEDLLSAAKSKYTTPQMIRTLIKSGANVNAKDYYGKTALMFTAWDDAWRGNVPEETTALLKAGADVYAKDNDGKTVLDYARTDEVKRLILNSAQ